jgi:hypothetical protein
MPSRIGLFAAATAPSSAQLWIEARALVPVESDEFQCISPLYSLSGQVAVWRYDDVRLLPAKVLPVADKYAVLSY